MKRKHCFCLIFQKPKHGLKTKERKLYEVKQSYFVYWQKINQRLKLASATKCDNKMHFDHDDSLLVKISIKMTEPNSKLSSPIKLVRPIIHHDNQISNEIIVSPHWLIMTFQFNCHVLYYH